MRIVLIPLLVLALAGCADANAPEESSAPAETSAPSTTPSEAPATSAPPTEQPAEPEAATCENLLDPETVKKGEAEGGSISEFTAEEAEDGGALKKFIEYGGVACRFGVDQTDSPVLYAYGPITAEQAKNQKAHLDKGEIESGTNENGGTYYGAPDDSEIYVFSPKGYWAYQYNNGFGNVINPDSVSATIEEVVANAPAFY